MLIIGTFYYRLICEEIDENQKTNDDVINKQESVDKSQESTDKSTTSIQSDDSVKEEKKKIKTVNMRDYIAPNHHKIEVDFKKHLRTSGADHILGTMAAYYYLKAYINGDILAVTTDHPNSFAKKINAESIEKTNKAIRERAQQMNELFKILDDLHKKIKSDTLDATNSEMLDRYLKSLYEVNIIKLLLKTLDVPESDAKIIKEKLLQASSNPLIISSEMFNGQLLEKNVNEIALTVILCTSIWQNINLFSFLYNQDMFYICLMNLILAHHAKEDQLTATVVDQVHTIVHKTKLKSNDQMKKYTQKLLSHSIQLLKLLKENKKSHDIFSQLIKKIFPAETDKMTETLFMLIIIHYLKFKNGNKFIMI